MLYIYVFPCVFVQNKFGYLADDKLKLDIFSFKLGNNLTLILILCLMQQFMPFLTQQILKIEIFCLRRGGFDK